MEAVAEAPTSGRVPGFVETYSKLIAMTIVGLEEAVGVASTGGVVNLVARRLLEETNPPRGSPEELLEWLNRETVLRLRPYRVGGRLVRDEPRGKAFYLVAYECPIRQILYLEDLPGGRSLCGVACRFLSLAFSEALGGRVAVEPARIGPNACLIRAALTSVDPSKVEAIGDGEPPKPSMDEYLERLQWSFRLLLRSIGWGLYKVLGSNPAMSYRAGKSYGRLTGAAILAEGYEAESLEEAVKLLNHALAGLVRVEYSEKGLLRVVESGFDKVVEEAGVEHPEFIERTLQGFLAGALETLLGKGLDLRSTGERRVYRVMFRG